MATKIQIFGDTAMLFTHLDHHAICLGSRPKTQLWQPCKYKPQKSAMHNRLVFGSLAASDMTKHICKRYCTIARLRYIQMCMRTDIQIPSCLERYDRMARLAQGWKCMHRPSDCACLVGKFCLGHPNLFSKTVMCTSLSQDLPWIQAGVPKATLSGICILCTLAVIDVMYNNMTAEATNL